jgi:hypothetical protein
MKMGAAGSSEMLKIIDRTPRRHVSEDSNLHSHSRENLKYHPLKGTVHSLIFQKPEHNVSEAGPASILRLGVPT